MITKRKGQSLIEFAMVALVTYLLLGAIITFGQSLYVAQQVQMSADFLARELSRQALPHDAYTIEEGLAQTSQSFRENIYDQTLLDVSLADVPNGMTLREWVNQDWPKVNQMLSGVMIVLEEGGQERFKLPGIVQREVNGETRFQIARFLDASLANDDDWIDVVEEVGLDQSNYDSLDPSTHGPFSVLHPSGGVVALRINYPVHSPVFSAHQPPANFGDSNADQVIAATGFTDTPAVLDPRQELYGGAEGLGRQYARGQQVRPYRRIVSGQAVYRREVFSQ